MRVDGAAAVRASTAFLKPRRSARTRRQRATNGSDRRGFQVFGHHGDPQVALWPP
jgi:hypothetical protein